MNRKSLIVALSIAAAAAGASAESYDAHNTPFVSTAQRAVVQSDATQARKTVNPWSTSYNPLAQFRSEKSRAQVSAEFIAERGTVAAFTGEDSGSALLATRARRDDRPSLAGQPVNAQ